MLSQFFLYKHQPKCGYWPCWWIQFHKCWETILTNSCRLSMTFWMPCTICMLFINCNIVTSMISFCSGQILYLALMVVFLLSTTRVTGIDDSSYWSILLPPDPSYWANRGHCHRGQGCDWLLTMPLAVQLAFAENIDKYKGYFLFFF